MGAMIATARHCPTKRPLYVRADHKRFSLATNINVYFCDPQSPWQRGSNENTMDSYDSTFPKGRTYPCIRRRT